jgi:hypothetical protein
MQPAGLAGGKKRAANGKKENIPLVMMTQPA